MTFSERDQSKIFDSLEQVLVTMGDKEQVPVLIMTRDQADVAELEKVAGDLQIKHRYRIVPAIAASVTRDQVSMLSRQSFVQHIELDQEVMICMDGASRWSGADKARTDFGVTGSDVVVAVIDTGIDPNHVDLAGGKVIGWQDWVNNRSSAYDDHGHGTHVAGIVAGTGEGNPAYKGVAPGASLVGLKVLDRNGSGSLSNVTAAVDWAVQNKDTYHIRVISMSRCHMT